VRIGLRLPACDRADRVAATAAHAEAAGFDSVWVPDSQLLWRDTFVALAFAAASTTRIALATGVTNLVTRHVTVVASAARTVQELAPGRFTLALGAGRSAADMAGAAHTPTRDLTLRNAPEAIAESLGVDRRPLRQAAGLPSDGTHPAAWAAAVASCDPLISDDAAMAYAQRYCLYGTQADIRRRMAELERAGVTTLITTPLAGDTTRTLPHEFIDSFTATGLTS
jgi:hypothetical protein